MRNELRDVDRCDGCGQHFDNEPPAPMLLDPVWSELAEDRKMLLCAVCMFDRAARRGVRLTLSSLKPVPVNLFCNPWSWFDLFLARGKNLLPEDFDLQPWRKAAEGCLPRELPNFFKRAPAPDEVQLELPFK